ncbi:membrane protein US8A [Bovine alphaherpesvirus 2]|uniref:Membrane protein US8A n=1 Tax=Bovine alphaherpesvirus 2 TaxID=10295 RepID=A0ABX6WLX3_9ALPH|nr:membrane protein US8A [Bovine alphaherpesvirus 2]QPO25202.1 membrane protein US8A [Bovine alphaherpesvirus 2]
MEYTACTRPSAPLAADTNPQSTHALIGRELAMLSDGAAAEAPPAAQASRSSMPWLFADPWVRVVAWLTARAMRRVISLGVVACGAAVYMTSLTRGA